MKESNQKKSLESLAAFIKNKQSSTKSFVDYFSTNYLNNTLSKKEDINNNWLKCTGCQKSLSYPTLKRHFFICYECGHYFQLKPKHIVSLFCNNNSFKEINQHIIPKDFLNFTDKVSYKKRIKQNQDITKCSSAMVTGTSLIGRTKVAIGILNFSFIGGSLSSVEGEKFLRLCKIAMIKIQVN